MPNRRRNIIDVVDISGLNTGATHRAAAAGDATPGPRRAFLSVWFRCCHKYGRMYRNAQGTRYDGYCPSCGARVHATIGPGGTNQRTFEAR